MVEAKNSYDILRFVALSTSVHADAVQCAVDDLRKVSHQMHSEEALLKVYEKEVSELSEQSQKLHVMNRLVTISRAEREKGEPLRAEESEVRYGGSDKSHIQSTKRRGVKHPPGTQGGLKQRISFRMGETTACGSEMRSSSSIPAESVDLHKVESESIANTTLTLDAQLAQLKRRMEELDAMSIRTKLMTLESLKRQASEVDAASILHRHVSSFQFPPEVSRLWRGGGGSSFGGEISAVKPPRHSSSMDKRTETRDFVQGAVINQDNIDQFLEMACNRLKKRYQHIFKVLTETDETIEDDAQRLLEYLFYAQKLDSADNYDIAAVQVLEGLQDETLARYYVQKRSHFTAEAKIAEHCLNRQQTVLSSLSYCALPMAWDTMQRLNCIPFQSFLPPARHILTPRFTFSNLSELNKLDELRVQVQRLLLKGLLENRQLVEDMLQLEGDSLSIDLKEKAILNVRAAIADAMASDEKSTAWVTVVEHKPYE